MNDFFDKNLLQNIIGGLVILFISYLLSRNAMPSVANKRGWKTVAIISWLLQVVAVIMFIVNAPSKGFDNTYVLLSLPLFLLGLGLKYIAKFFIWW